MKFTCFKIQDQGFAIPVHWVREIVNPPKLSEVPGSPSGILGLINLRGQIITLMDPLHLISPDEEPQNLQNPENGKIIVFLNSKEIRWSAIESAKQARPLEDPLAFYVTVILGVVDLDEDQIQDLPQFKGKNHIFLNQVFEHENVTFRVLDMQVIFNYFKEMSGELVE